MVTEARLHLPSKVVGPLAADRNSSMLGDMDHNVTAVERAFQLAKSGICLSVADLKKRLRLEGYATTQIVGGAISKQLRALIEAAQK